MHGQWRWFVAAAVAAIVALSSRPGETRTHRHAHAAPHPTSQASPPPAPPQAAPSVPASAPAASAPAAAVAAKPDAGAAGPETPPSPVAYGKAGTPAIVLDTHAVQAVLGKGVRSSTGEDMGRLVDIVVDHDGRPRAAIIDFGGFLGVGSRKIAVDWGVLNFSGAVDKGVITAELTRDQVKSAPEFKEGSPVVVLGALASPPAAVAPQGQEK